jgi:hypothetical protein
MRAIFLRSREESAINRPMNRVSGEIGNFAGSAGSVLLCG